MKDRFRRVASTVSNIAGSAWVFCLAVLVVLIWAGSGSAFNYSDTWQLVINTGTTIVTFLMVFLIQNTQNRDARAMQLKLDELLRATKARDSFIDIEDLSDAELAELAQEFSRIQKADLLPASLPVHLVSCAASLRLLATSDGTCEKAFDANGFLVFVSIGVIHAN